MSSVSHLKLLMFVRKILAGETFGGNYIESVFIEQLGSYRSAIVVDKSNVKLVTSLRSVREHLLIYESIRWPGVTESSAEDSSTVCTIWTKVLNIPFGNYVWKIEDVSLVSGELVFEVEVVTKPFELTEKPSLNWSSDETLTRVKQGFHDVVTLNNAKEATKFVSVLVVVLFGIVLELFKILVSALVQLFTVFPKYIDSLMPAFLAVINFLTKCVGGLYILIAMWYRGPPPRPANSNQNNPSLEYRLPPPYRLSNEDAYKRESRSSANRSPYRTEILHQR